MNLRWAKVLIIVIGLVSALWFVFKPRAQTPVIGILHPSAVHTPAVSGFIEQMREYGFEEGSSVVYMYDGPVGSGKNLVDRAQELVASGATLIYSASTPATKTALEAVRGTDVKVVFGPVNDPVGAKIVESLRRPGGAVTGVTLAPSTARRLAWFKEFDPSVSRVLAPFNPDDQSSTTSLARAESAAVSLGLEIVPHEVRNPDEVRALFGSMPEDIHGVFLPRDSMINSTISDIVAATIDQKLPLSGPGFNQVTRGALFGYGVRQGSVGRTAARLANEVLSGADPAVIPIETVESHLYINIKTAGAIGLDLSPALLSQAQLLLP